MAVIVSMLRGINLAGHNRIRMDALKALYESLGLQDVQTYIQSGNVIFRTRSRDTALLSKRIQKEMERSLGFRVDIVCRTSAELRDAIARNPFAGREAIDPSRLLITFLLNEPGAEAREKAHAIKVGPEELRIVGSHLYIYFPDGIGKSKLQLPLIERTIKTSGTARNLNTVTKLLEMAEKLEASR